MNLILGRNYCRLLTTKTGIFPVTKTGILPGIYPVYSVYLSVTTAFYSLASFLGFHSRNPVCMQQTVGDLSEWSLARNTQSKIYDYANS